MGVSFRFGFGFHDRQPLQDAAGLHGLLALTSLAQGGQLQLEMSTWANHPRIEKIARDRLHMVTPSSAVAKGVR